LLATQTNVRTNIVENRRQRANTQGIMFWNRDVVLSILLSRKPQVATCLPGGAVAKYSQRSGKLVARHVAR
jgi:hypothetical protein